MPSSKAAEPSPREGLAPPVSKVSAPTVRGGGRGGVGALWVLVVLLIAAVVWLGWQHWLAYSAGDLAARQQAVTTLERGMDTMGNDLAGLRRELETRLIQIEQRATIREEDLRERLQEQQARLNDLVTTDHGDWVLGEADYLVRLASHRLLVDRDVVVATTLLENADQLLQTLDDPQLFRLRQALAGDVAALRLIEGVDRTGIYLRIDALQHAIADLPLESYFHERGEALVFTVEEAEDGVPASWWTSVIRRLKGAWHQLDDYIRIYRRDQPLQPLLSPDEEVYLRLNLRLMLEQAQLALLQQEPGAYEVSLNKARKWLQDYFVADERSQALQTKLGELSGLVIVQALPTLDDSLNAMRQVLRARPQQRSDDTGRGPSS